MDTFPIVRRKDEAAHGEYRTKRLILERYDALAECIANGIEDTVLNVVTCPSDGSTRLDGWAPRCPSRRRWGRSRRTLATPTSSAS